MIREVEKFYEEKDEPNRGCLLALRSIILDLDSNMTETQKWGMPCFCYKKKMFCYLWVDKKTKEPYILVVHGKLIDHPMLEEGNRTKMKIIRVNANEHIPVEPILEVLNMALEICRNKS